MSWRLCVALLFLCSTLQLAADPLFEPQIVEVQQRVWVLRPGTQTRIMGEAGDVLEVGSAVAAEGKPVVLWLAPGVRARLAPQSQVRLMGLHSLVLDSGNVLLSVEKEERFGLTAGSLTLYPRGTLSVLSKGGQPRATVLSGSCRSFGPNLSSSFGTWRGPKPLVLPAGASVQSRDELTVSAVAIRSSRRRALMADGQGRFSVKVPDKIAGSRLVLLSGFRESLHGFLATGFQVLGRVRNATVSAEVLLRTIAGPGGIVSDIQDPVPDFKAYY